MSNHPDREHQMTPDYATQLYAWRYKCAIAGCDYETGVDLTIQECPICATKNAEIAALRADRDVLLAVARTAINDILTTIFNPSSRRQSGSA